MLSSVRKYLKKGNQEITRESNVELLRILAILGVIILHYNNDAIGGGLVYVQGHNINKMVLLFLEGLCICAVDLFILISGFFSIKSDKRNLVKIVELLIQFSIFQVIRYLLVSLYTGEFGWFGLLRAMIPADYFVILYIVLYVISPFINKLMRNLSEVQLKNFAVLVFCLFSVYPTAVKFLEKIVGTMEGLSSVGISGDDNGYTIVIFILMYILGAAINLMKITVKKWTAGLVVILNSIVIGFIGPWSYSNPLIIVNAVMLFCFFREWRIHSRVINELSKAAFTCFCVHLIVLDRFNIEKAVQENTLYMIGHILIACISIYAISYVVYKGWKLVSAPFLRVVEHWAVKMKVDF